jgi:hypothetical protein
MATTAEAPSNQPVASTLALWFAVLGGPIAWAAHLQVVYSFSQQACEGDVPIALLHVLSVACLALCLASGIVAVFQWRQSGRGWPSETDEGFDARRRFMSAEGMLSGALFTLVIIAQWLAVVFLSPCPL